MLRLGHKLKEYLENDYNMINQQFKLIELPSKMPVTTILENFVKQYAIRSICYPKDDLSYCLKRKRRNSQIASKMNNSGKTNLEEIIINIDLCKEVVDGLRIYFDFTIQDYLLYNKEKEQYNYLMSQDNLKNFKYVPSGL